MARLMGLVIIQEVITTYAEGIWLPDNLPVLTNPKPLLPHLADSIEYFKVQDLTF